MREHQLIIAPAARDDLSNIYRFGLRNWGEKRSSKYLKILKEHFWSLTLHPLIGVERTELISGIRTISAGSHIIFYRISVGSIEVVRVLHGSQDPNRHIK